MTKELKLQSPFDVETPKGCEGWQEMYPSYYLFSKERREFEEGKIWFVDTLHHPEPMAPFDLILPECWQISLSQYNSRIFAVPSALGIDHRVINGYVYISPTLITDPETIERRKALFERRIRYYYDNFEVLYHLWKKKVIANIEELKKIRIKSLPEFEDESIIKDAVGVSSGHSLIENYDRLIENMYKDWQLHSEMGVVGYGAYLVFTNFCREVFPEIKDITLGKMVSGVEVDILMPDEKLKELAKLALKLKVDKKIEDMFEKGIHPEQIMAELKKDQAGSVWVDKLEEVRDPWFYFGVGMGNFYHKHVGWNDDLRLPFRGLMDYIKRLRQREDISRPFERLKQERDTITEEYRNLLPTEEHKEAFDQLLKTTRTVYPFVENHPFYCEHWHHVIFWNKIREIGDILVDARFIKDREHIFYLHRAEILQLLYELVISWSVGTPAQAPGYLPDKVKRREEILERLGEWNPPPALGTIPEKITEPWTVMLWGVTSERLREWGVVTGKILKGSAGSPGIAEGKARVIRSADKADLIQQGEILVCPVTAPAWGPIFSKIKGVVTDTGGVMAHASIIAREYGIPAVVGTGSGTSTIKTGDRIRMDGSEGVVEILS